MGEEEIDLVFDDHYRDIRDRIADKYFEKANGKRDACLFALSLGIKLDKGIPRNKWKGKPLSWTDLDRLKSQIGDFSVLFEYLNLKNEERTTKLLIDEFVTGGLKHIDDNALDEDGNLREISLG